MAQEQKPNFNQIFSEILADRLSMYNKREINRATCIEIYTVIFNVLTDIVKQAEVALTNEGVNYIAQQYYLSVLINPGAGNQELDETIFDKLAKLENIETKELLLIGGLMRGTGFLPDIVREIKRRG